MLAKSINDFSKTLFSWDTLYIHFLYLFFRHGCVYVVTSKQVKIEWGQLSRGVKSLWYTVSETAFFLMTQLSLLFSLVINLVICFRINFLLKRKLSIIA